MIRKSHGVAFAALALAASGAFAQSTVNLYGTLDASFVHTTETGTKSTNELASGVMTESFIGLRGSEDLGSGLKGIFSIESFLDITNGDAATASLNKLRDGAGFWGRNTYVGLGGDFGTVKIGVQDTILFTQQAAYNPFGTSVISPTMILGGTEFTAQGWTQTISYATPNLSGFTGALAYHTKSNNQGDGANVAIGLNYAAGPVGVGFAYEQDKALTTLSIVNTIAANGGLGLTSQNKATNWTLGGSYDFSVVKLFAQYGQGKINPADVTDKYYQLGLSAPVTASGTAMLSFGQNKFDPSDAKDRVFSIGYDQALSKRTDAYIAYSNDHVTGGSTTDTGNTFAIGVRHSF